MIKPKHDMSDSKWNGFKGFFHVHAIWLCRKKAPKGSINLVLVPQRISKMSDAAPYKRTRVFLACLNCRKRKIKCLTEDSEQKPCERCVRKGLLCEYRPVADEEPSAGIPSGASRPSAGQPIPHPGTTPCHYFGAGPSPRPPQGGNAQYPATSKGWGSTPNDFSQGGQRVPPGSRPLYTAPQGYNAATYDSMPVSPYGGTVPPPQSGDSSAYLTMYRDPSNWPQFSPLSGQPQ
ncbi:hypothetical protein C8R47DRAFT_1073910 [Mycena vitilis]|nr:hypothetical protein C8R47DRAFT_1073910 [Mycena vitilis]